MQIQEYVYVYKLFGLKKKLWVYIYMCIEFHFKSQMENKSKWTWCHYKCTFIYIIKSYWHQFINRKKNQWSEKFRFI